MDGGFMKINRARLGLLALALTATLNVLAFDDDSNEKKNPRTTLQRALHFETQPQVRVQILLSLKDFITEHRSILHDVMNIAFDQDESFELRKAALHALSWHPRTTQLGQAFSKLIQNKQEDMALREFAIRASYNIAKGSRQYTDMLLRQCLLSTQTPLQLRQACAFVTGESASRTRDVKTAFINLLNHSQTPLELKIEILRSSLSIIQHNDFRNLILSFASDESLENKLRIASLRLIRPFIYDSRSRSVISQIIRSANDEVKVAAYDAYKKQLSDEDIQWFRLTSWPQTNTRRDPL